MAAITIRDLDDNVKKKLKIQAAKNGVSMEAEARKLLTKAVEPKNALEALQACFPPDWEGIELDLPPRGERERPLPEFEL